MNRLPFEVDLEESAARPAFTLGHRPALDGIRGLAILLVFLSHASLQSMGGGFVGVDLFFVLSGFLITALLLEEWRDTGRISLKSFYARRAIRLLPALVLMLITVVLVSSLIEPRWKTAQFRTSGWMTLLYVANWFTVERKFPSPELAHTWSLSVEEQFYIVWPIILSLLLRSRATKAAVLGLVAASVVGVAGLRLFLWTTSGSWVRGYFGSDTHADGLLSGAMVAMIMTWGWGPRSPGTIRVLNGVSTLALGLVPIFVVAVRPMDGRLYDGGYLGVNLAIASVVMAAVSSPWAPLRLLLESAAVRWIGRISYGVYLWHMPAFWWVRRMQVPPGLRSGILAFILTLSIAAVSFYALERPLLRLKRRFERVVPRVGPGPL